MPNEETADRRLPPGFEWDWPKAHYNEWKHGVTFPEAATVFDDPGSITSFDEKNSIEAHEDRWVLVGLSAQTRLLVVAHAERGDKIRIISARFADRGEKRKYEESQEAGEAD